MELKLKEYASLLVRSGVNVSKGQNLFISSDIECAPLTRLCVEEAYAAGAREVHVQWVDDSVTRQRYLNAQDEVFDTVPQWMGQMYDYQLETNAARLTILGSDPQALTGVDPLRIQRWQQSFGKRLERYYSAMTSNQFQWCIGAYSTKSWAKKVFPQLEESQAVIRLWDEIFKACRIEGDGRAAERWRTFTKAGKRRIDILNKHNFRYLKYQNSLGTDLKVELPKGHYWSGAAELAQNGVEFIANIPTEEIFSLPKRDGVNGVVYASKPLVLNGNIVEGICMRFKDGKIIEATAKTGQQHLAKALEVDEGASYLGEVALVPYDSPISNSGVLFYNTLFDENASCHLAFGEAYPMVEGAANLSREEKKALGINQSIVHEDFMIGTADLSIVGITHTGMDVPVFIDGNFAF